MIAGTDQKELGALRGVIFDMDGTLTVPPTCFVHNTGTTDFSDMADFTVTSLVELGTLLFGDKLG